MDGMPSAGSSAAGSGTSGNNATNVRTTNGPRRRTVMSWMPGHAAPTLQLEAPISLSSLQNRTWQLDLKDQLHQRDLRQTIPFLGYLTMYPHLVEPEIVTDNGAIDLIEQRLSAAMGVSKRLVRILAGLILLTICIIIAAAVAISILLRANESPPPDPCLATFQVSNVQELSNTFTSLGCSTVGGLVLSNIASTANISIPSLISVTGQLLIYNCNFTSITFPNLLTANNVTVSNCINTQLVTFPQLENVRSLSIGNNTLLQEADFDSLLSGETITAVNNAVLNKLYFGKLSNCTIFTVSNNTLLFQLDVQQVTSISALTISSIGKSPLRDLFIQSTITNSFAVAFPSLVHSDSIFLQSLYNISLLDFTALTTATVSLQVQDCFFKTPVGSAGGQFLLENLRRTGVLVVRNTFNMFELNAPQLTQLDTLTLDSNTILNVIGFPLLQVVSELEISFNSNLLLCLFPSLTLSHRQIRIYVNSVLTSVQFPALTTSVLIVLENPSLVEVLARELIIGSIGIYRNPLLVTMDFTNLASAAVVVIRENDRLATAEFPNLFILGSSAWIEGTPPFGLFFLLQGTEFSSYFNASSIGVMNVLAGGSISLLSNPLLSNILLNQIFYGTFILVENNPSLCVQSSQFTQPLVQTGITCGCAISGNSAASGCLTNSDNLAICQADSLEFLCQILLDSS